MIEAHAEILIDRPQERVFAFIARDFFANYPRWSPEVQRLEVLTPGPLQVGSRARQVRVDQGRRSETTFRVIALHEPQQVDFAESSDLFRIGYRLEPAGAATRLICSFQLRRLELYMRPFRSLIRRSVQEGVDGVVLRIKELVEREPGDPPQHHLPTGA